MLSVDAPRISSRPKPRSSPRFLTLALASALLFAPTPARAQTVPWPAESWSQALNLTQVESNNAPGTNNFYTDLSGAYWNPTKRRLWLVRNGPTNTTSKVWSLREVPGASGAAAWAVDTNAQGVRAEWTGFNDAEAITQVDDSSNIVYIMAEGEEVIRAYDLSINGVATLLRTYNTLRFLPVSGNQGSEGLAFVPDSALSAQNFVTPAGTPYTSTLGMGGLMFVGHQNGGRVYAFDLSPTSTGFIFVGSYLTGDTDTSELTFDRATQHLLVLHGSNVNTIEECALSSTAVTGGRRLTSIRTYARPTGSPTNANIEGLALFGPEDCVSGHRRLFLTIDGGDATSLLQFSLFPCPCRADIDNSSAVDVADIFAFLSLWFANDPRADIDNNTLVEVPDIFAFLGLWFAGCA